MLFRSSHFYAIENEGFSPGLNEFSIRRHVIDKLIGGTYTYINNFLSKKVFFSIFSADSMKHNFSFLNNYDVIHIHNWYNLLSLSSLKNITNLNKPIIFTMHDQRLMTGGCHYSFDCRKFHTNCLPCPDLPIVFNSIPFMQLNILKRRLTAKSIKAIISPSQWLIRELKHSDDLKNVEIVKIPNYFEFNFDNTSHRAFLKEDTLRNIVIGVASVHPFSFIKGGQFLHKLKNFINDNKLPFEIIFLKDYVSTNQGIKLFWERIDLLLVPSVIDNAPNVIFEAKFYGKPIAAANVGGIPEFIDRETDFLFDQNEDSVELILKKIRGAVSKKYNYGKQHEYLRTLNAASLQLHLDLYSKFHNI